MTTKSVEELEIEYEKENRSRKEVNVYLDEVGFNEMSNRLRLGSKAWWERLSDFTEIETSWLKENVDLAKVHFIYTDSKEKHGKLEVVG